jgi:hypothetical protein
VAGGREAGSSVGAGRVVQARGEAGRGSDPAARLADTCVWAASALLLA